MASRVNVKFVVILSIVMILLAAGAGVVAVKVVFKSAADLVAKGDAKMAEKDYVGAEQIYSKAVHKEPYNAEYLIKWRESLESWTPETDRDFSTEFRNTYIALHSQLARSDSMSHPEYQVQYAQLKYDAIEGNGFNRGAFEALINELNDFIKINETSHPNDPVWLPLRRLRGMALGRIASNGFDLTTKQQETAHNDLNAVLKQNPADYDAMENILGLMEQDAASTRDRDLQSQADKILLDARHILDAFVETNGKNSVAGIQGWMLQIEKNFADDRKEAAIRLGSQAMDEIKSIALRYHETTQEVGNALEARPADELTAPSIRRLMALESQTDPSGSFKVTQRITTRALETKPGDAELMLIMADVLNAQKKHDEAYALLEKVKSMPKLTLGLPGLKLISNKTSATYQQAKIAIAAIAQAENEETRQTWLKKAQAARTDLGEMISDASPPVKLLDARIAQVNGDMFAAQKLVDEYNQMTSNASIEGLWFAADISSRLKEPGTAKIALTRIIALDPTASNAQIALADIEYRLGRMESARSHYLEGLKHNPDSEALMKRVAEIEKRLGMRKADNPVEEAILEARRAAAGSETQIADAAGAVKILEEALVKLGPDETLYNELIRLQLRAGNSDAAKETVIQAVKDYPDNAQLKKFGESLAKSDTLEGMVEVILDQEERTDAEKWLAIYAIYKQVGKNKLAADALLKATAAEPDSPAVIELQFTHAFAAKDIETAKRLAKRAKELDIDHVGGQSYRARVLMLEGKNDEAIVALNEAVDRNPNSAALWRILGSFQMRSGQIIDAIASFQRSLEIRPNDMTTVYDYCTSLVKLGRLPEALDVAHRSEVYGRQDKRFMELLLNLESRVGDKENARRKREKILEIRPKDMANRYALIGLYIDLGQWDDARTLIEDTRSIKDLTNSLIDLDARWYAEQNQLEEARQIYASAIAQLESTDRMDKYMLLGNFMLTHNRPGFAITALEQGAKYQPQGEHVVDAMLADTLMINNRNSEAYHAYRRIIDDNSDSDGTYTKRAAEALIRIDRFTEAEDLLSKIPQADTDVTVVLLRADAALSRGEAARALTMLDDAVSQWPDDPRAWLKRADAFSRDKDTMGEALADVDQALTLVPGLSTAYRQKANILAKMGRDNDAIEALKDAILLNPQLDDLRVQLMVEMIRRDMNTDVVGMADDWIKLHPQDISLRSRIAELFIQGGMKTEAIHIYQDLLTLEQQPKMVLRLADLLISENPPRYIDAERLFVDAREITVSDPALLLARAQMFANTNRIEAAHNDCNLSFKIISHKPGALMFWYTTLRSVYPKTPDLLGYLQSLSTQPGGRSWATLFQARTLFDDEATVSQGLDLLRGLADETRDTSVRYATLRALAGQLYNRKDSAGAVTAWKQALELTPKDGEVENNIAYALATDLNNPKEALQYAELAAKHIPNNVGVLDTLGTVYLALDRPKDAVAPLEIAVRLSRQTPADAQYMVRLAQAKLHADDTQGAKDLVAEVEGLLDRGRKLDDQYTAILDQVRNELGQG